ncbi:MAG: ABC transporter permease [Planctomycetota bacterium]|nr:ABC transporter permease [Planctomycetota bacterium]
MLSVDGLAVRAGGVRLLAPSHFELYEGERVVLVGPSGYGKSLFADLLLGFAGRGSIGLDVEGELALDGEPLLAYGPQARDHRVGAVFQMQRSGLFDDLTIEQNLRFGSEDESARSAVIESLRLEHVERPVTQCSGGEGVRVALARTLLRGAGVIVYDEPTTGLDPLNARGVVAAIGEAHRRLSIVITHDYAAFGGQADVVLFLDPSDRTLKRLEAGPATFARIEEALGGGRAAAPEPAAATPWLGRLRAGWLHLALGTSEFLLDALWLLAWPWAWLRSAHPLDGPRLRQALRRDLAPGVLAFVGLSAMLVAVTGTYFLFERLPKRVWTEPLVQDDLVTGLGLIFGRIGIPLLVSVLLAAKLGAAAAAHLGHMSLTRQLDALDLLAVPRRRHLLLPLACGQLASAWASTALAVGLSYLTSMVVFLALHPGYSAVYFHHAFLAALDGDVVLWVLAKTGVSALGVAAVAFRVGTAPMRAPAQVVGGIHRTLLRALLLVLLVHALFAFAEY